MKINRFIENNTYIDENEKSIVRFGVSMMISNIITLVVAIVIAMVLRMLPEGILLLVSIIVLRQYAGGYHANSQRLCAFISCIIYIVGLIIIRNNTIYNIIQLIVCLVATIIIFFLSPVDNINNELSDSEKKYLKNKVRILLSIEVVIFVMLLINGAEYWSEIIVVAIMIVAGLVLIGFIKNRIRG